MKRWLTAICCLIVLSVALSATAHHNSAEAQFDKLKALEGEWHGKSPEGGNIVASYEVVANGSTVMERMKNGDHPAMITMYHMNGKKLMMTHYCSAMNQPRMKAKDSQTADTIEFEMIDITNLPDENAGHMKALTLSIKSSDLISHAWTFMEKEKAMSVPFELRRAQTTQK